MIFRNNRIMTVVISVILIAIISFSVQAGVKLRVWDDGGSQDDEADVYFDNTKLGRSAPTSEGTTWDLGELTTGKYELKIIHKVDPNPPGTYAWELSGGGISANDDEAEVDTDSSMEIKVLNNDTLVQTSAGETPTLCLPGDYNYCDDCSSNCEKYTTTIQVDDASDELNVSSVANPSKGSAEIVSDGKSIKYTPDSDACGTDSFTYEASDGSGNTGTATVEVTLNDKTPPDIDTPADKTISCEESPDPSNTGEANATDNCEVDAVTYSDSSSGTCPTVISRIWTAEDSFGNSTSSEQVITVQDNTAPFTTDDEFTVSDRTESSLDVLTNDRDSCSEKLTLESTSSPTYGTTEITDNKVKYDPAYGYIGEATFSYTVSDRCGNESTGRVRLTVEHDNRSPEADANGPYMAIPGQTVLLDGSGSTDPDAQDRLQYRWDINNDGIYDTDWRDESSYETSWEEPYQGQVVLQVRDLFRGAPTGDTSTDESSVSIEDQFGPKIELTTSGPEAVKPGEEFTFSILTTNRGSMDAINTKLSLALPNVFEVTNADPGFTGEEPYTWEVGQVSPDESIEVELTIGVPLNVPEERGPVFPVEVSLNYLTARGAEMPAVSESIPIELVAGPRIKVEIFRDENGDGERNEGEAGLSGIPVALSDVEVSRTDKKGQVLFRGIEPGNYPISLAEEGLERLNELNLVVSREKQEVELEDKEILTVLFPASNKWGQVNGLVFSDSNENGKKDEGEKGIANLQLTMDGQKKTSTDSSGQFKFREITPGDHTLLVKAESGQTRTVNFSLQSGDSTSLKIPWVSKSGGFLNVEIGNEGGE